MSERDAAELPMDHQRAYYPGLEVSTSAQVGQGLEVFRGDDGLEVVNFGLDGVGSGSKSEAEIKESERKEPGRKKLWLIVAGVVISLLVIAAAVAGGVVASRRHGHKSATTRPDDPAGSQPSSTPSTSSNSSGSPNAAYARSGVGVTGWWTSSSSFNIRLVYQGQDGDLRLMRYHSGDGKWSMLATFGDTKAKRGTPIAASCFNVPVFYFTPVTDSNNYMQVEIFYLNDQDQLQEWVYREQDIPSSSAQTHNGSGIMSSKGWKAGTNSRLAAYWPSVIYQDGDNLMQEAYLANLTWNQEKVGLKCHGNSSIAEIPYTVNAGRSGGERLIYQRDDQKLLVEKRHNLTDELSTDAPAFIIPANAPMGAFTVPRDSTNTSDGAMNTYILWRDDTGALQMTWEDDSTGWRTSSTPASLGSPDNGTDISCLTPTIWSVTSLLSDYGMARCYYLVDGHIREVQYDGSNWSVIGNVQVD